MSMVIVYNQKNKMCNKDFLFFTKAAVTVLLHKITEHSKMFITETL